VEVNVSARFVGHVRAEVATNDTVPIALVFSFEGSLHVGGDFLLVEHSGQGVLSLVNCELVHLLIHVLEHGHWFA